VEWEQFTPGVDGCEILVGHARVVECAGQIEAEVIRCAECAVGRGAGLDGQHLLEDFLLAVLGDDVVKDAQDIGLLAEDFLVGVVGDEAAGS